MRFQAALNLERLRTEHEQDKQVLNPMRQQVNQFYTASKIWYDPIRLSIERTKGYQVDAPKPVPVVQRVASFSLYSSSAVSNNSG